MGVGRWTLNLRNHSARFIGCRHNPQSAISRFDKLKALSQSKGNPQFLQPILLEPPIECAATQTQRFRRLPRISTGPGERFLN